MQKGTDTKRDQPEEPGEPSVEAGVSGVSPRELLVDCTHLAGFLIDLPPGSLVGLRARRDGYREVVTEIVSNQAMFGDKSGLLAEDVELLIELNRQVELIEEQLPVVRKLLELLEESRAKIDDRCQTMVATFARIVELRTKLRGDRVLLARYEKTCRYRSAIAAKGAKTRRKNRAAKAAAVENEPSGGK